MERVKRPKTGGRQKGTPNKKTLWLYQQLKDRDCDIFDQLAGAITSKDLEFIKTLTPILQYVSPRPKEVIDDTTDTAGSLTIEEVRKLAALAR